VWPQDANREFRFQLLDDFPMQLTGPFNAWPEVLFLQ
jgi:hypothetical protein